MGTDGPEVIAPASTLSVYQKRPHGRLVGVEIQRRRRFMAARWRLRMSTVARISASRSAVMLGLGKSHRNSRASDSRSHAMNPAAKSAAHRHSASAQASSATPLR